MYNPALAITSVAPRYPSRVCLSQLGLPQCATKTLSPVTASSTARSWPVCGIAATAPPSLPAPGCRVERAHQAPSWRGSCAKIHVNSLVLCGCSHTSKTTKNKTMETHPNTPRHRIDIMDRNSNNSRHHQRASPTTISTSLTFQASHSRHHPRTSPTIIPIISAWLTSQAIHCRQASKNFHQMQRTTHASNLDIDLYASLFFASSLVRLG